MRIQLTLNHMLLQLKQKSQTSAVRDHSHSTKTQRHSTLKVHVGRPALKLRSTSCHKLVLLANTYFHVSKSHIYNEPHQETASKHSAEVLHNQTPHTVN